MMMRMVTARQLATTKAQRDVMWEGSLRRKFGITVDQYYALLAKQNHCCAICKAKCATGYRLAVDHDHVTGEVRGLLCQGCNTGVGKFKDSPELLRSAAEYLENPVNTPTTSMVHKAA
jgi:hypothetical protein